MSAPVKRVARSSAKAPALRSRSRSWCAIRTPRKPAAAQAGCRILYRDIGDYLKREEKLAILRKAGSIAGIDDWREIKPDRHHDWIGQRDEAFQDFYPLGSKATKAGKSDDSIFKLYSRGLATNRDAYLYNFSRTACEENARGVVGDYMGAKQMLEENPRCSVEEAARRNSSQVRWDRDLKNKLRRRRAATFSPERIWKTSYRPFVKQHCYVDYLLMSNKYQQDRIFPLPPPPPVQNLCLPPHKVKESRHLRARCGCDQGVLGSDGRHDAGHSADVQRTVLPALPARVENRVICVPGIGANKPFSVLIADRTPDLHFLEFGQCFPRWTYPQYPRGCL